MSKTVAIGLACGLLMAGCTGQQVLNTLTPARGYTVAENLVYAPALGLRLDIYTPDGVARAPVVVFLHGGRWSGGSKRDYRFVGEALASRGFVAVIPDMRWYPSVRFPAFVEDAAQAVVWAREQAGHYGGEPARLYVMGHSSGAHIAAMLALNPAYLQAAGGQREWLSGMIGLAGPYDFLPLTEPDLRDIFGPPQRFDESQPIKFVDGRSPPLLLMHAEDDAVVWPRNTRNLAAAVTASGGRVETVIYDTVRCGLRTDSHYCIAAALSAPFRRKTDTLDHIAEFVGHTRDRGE